VLSVPLSAEEHRRLGALARGNRAGTSAAPSSLAEAMRTAISSIAGLAAEDPDQFDRAWVDAETPQKVRCVFDVVFQLDEAERTELDLFAVHLGLDARQAARAALNRSYVDCRECGGLTPEDDAADPPTETAVP
jgi:hypothetical protein